MISPDKLVSFINLCRKGVVEIPSLVAYFQEFSESTNPDAESFYISKGQHNLANPISDTEICSWINDIMDTNNWTKKHVGACNTHKGYVLRHVLTKSGATLDPHRAKAVINEFFKEKR